MKVTVTIEVPEKHFSAFSKQADFKKPCDLGELFKGMSAVCKSISRNTQPIYGVGELPVMTATEHYIDFVAV